VRQLHIPWDKLRAPARSLTGMGAYQVSKLSNVLFSHSLSKRLAGTGVSTYSLHPGVVASDIWRRLPWPLEGIAKRFMISVQEGAATQLYCATAADIASATGRYYDKCAETQPNRAARNDELAEELWARSLEWTGAPDIVLS
jgi:NAD(P)-dependent dehydrogenase (short-subunit alcohol dehydrogenase family)